MLTEMDGCAEGGSDTECNNKREYLDKNGDCCRNGDNIVAVIVDKLAMMTKRKFWMNYFKGHFA